MREYVDSLGTIVDTHSSNNAWLVYERDQVEGLLEDAKCFSGHWSEKLAKWAERIYLCRDRDGLRGEAMKKLWKDAKIAYMGKIMTCEYTMSTFLYKY
jgi:hypothetical protein